MNLRTMILGILAILSIFISYIYLQPINNKATAIAKSYYVLKIVNINKNNKWSAFRNKGQGKFFIHPGQEKSSKVIFTFLKNTKLSLLFSIAKGSKVGNIKFTIKKNKKDIDTFIVTTKQTKQINISIRKDDKLEIIANKNGKTTADWGNFQIKVKDDYLIMKNYIIPFLWIILFIYLLGKQHSYIAINSYIIFLLILFAEKINFGTLSFETVFAYTIILFSLTFIFVFIYQELTQLRKFRLAFIFSFFTSMLVYLIPLIFIIYTLNFDQKITKEILYAMFQSNNNEAYEYISDFISIKYIFLFTIIIIFIGILLYKQEKKELPKIEKSLLIFMIVVFLSMGITQFSHLRLFNFVNDGMLRYKQELQQFKKMQDQRKTKEIKFNASKNKKGETYIVVIGESLNKKHMGLYGYLRETTPNLTQMNREGNLLVFDNIYSCATHTVDVLSLSLTEANMYNGKKYFESPSIIEVLKKADIETYWLTNQTIYGAWDNMVSVIGTSTDHVVALNKNIGTQSATTHYDGDIIKEVKKILSNKVSKNRVIFVHLMGSHGRYSSRYPNKEYTIFKGDLKPGNFGLKTSKNKKINDYDNSVYYNDMVVSSILNELKKEKEVSGFFYMSDHADDAIRNLGHNASKFTFEMTQIPMVLWVSEAYKENYTNKFNTLVNHKKTLFSNDMFYDTILGFVGVKTDVYNSKYDFTSNRYSLNPENALLRYGAKNYTDEHNYIYWQKVNTQYLVDINQSSRIFPHRVDSIGKLKDIWNDGFRSFEVDVIFSDKGEESFIVGHDYGLANISLEKFISSIEHTQIERVWLDFKNLNVKNIEKALNRLTYLDKKYNLKEKFIVESGIKKNFFKEIHKAGWHTSYYMPTKKIVDLIKVNNIKAMEELANSIFSQVNKQEVNAISFDSRLYPFVKKYMEPLLDNHIVYHIWYAPSLFSAHFIPNLQKNKYYLDSRIKTLLTQYKSQYNL